MIYKEMPTRVSPAEIVKLGGDFCEKLATFFIP